MDEHNKANNYYLRNSIAQAQNKLLNKRDQIPIDSILVDLKVTLYRSISFYLINPFCDFK